ncbi:MAG: condensation domain-containing protein, partial [Ruminococcus sp.]|nr:condensation domain-containing protein [Ruminococcus sp.]
MAKKSIVNKNIENVYTLTPLQEGMLFHNIYETGSSAYVLQSVFEIKSVMNEEILKQALSLVSQRFSVLRTSFFYEKVDKPRQVVLRKRDPEFISVDLSSKTNEEQKESLTELLRKDVKRGFDLQRDTLLRVHYIIMGNTSKLVLTMHHIIIDGWCMNIVFNKLISYYYELQEIKPFSKVEKEMLDDKRNDTEYSEYITWISNQDNNAALSYWTKYLEDYDSSCEIAPMIKPEFSDEQMKRVYASVDEISTQRIKKYVEDNESTLNTFAEVAVGILLQEYSRSRDVVFGKVISGRNANLPGIENMVGLFVNTIPVRVKTDNNITFGECMRQQQYDDLQCLTYDYCSLAEIQSRTPQGRELIKVLYAFENYNSGMAGSDSDNSEGDITLDSAREQTNYPISITIYEMNQKLSFNIMYDPNEFIEHEIEAILERLVKICEEISLDPNRTIDSIETVTEKEKELILNDFNATETEYPRDKTVVELFEEQVAKTPD